MGDVTALENERLRVLQELGLLDTVEDDRFDRITAFAADRFHVPISLISLVDRDRQWFKSHHGLDVRETPRAVSFCAHAIVGDDTFVVPDARTDVRFVDNSLVTGPPHIRFYAGQPIVDSNGWRLGTLNIIDTRPRDLSAADRALLQVLAHWVEAEITLTEVGALRDRALRANEARRSFLARLAHELRTPLNSVYGYAQLLEMQLVADVDLEPTVDHILSGCRRLTALIDDLLDVSLIDTGGTTLRMTAVPLAPLAEAVLDLCRPEAEARGIELRATAELDGLVARADEQRLVQVLTNLVVNAVRYNRRGGNVTITGHEESGEVVVDVADTGWGIADQDLLRAFQPFDRLDADDRGEPGTGLGLTIAQSLAERMQGRLTARSTPDVGSTFTVVLPVADVDRPPDR